MSSAHSRAAVLALATSTLLFSAHTLAAPAGSANPDISVNGLFLYKNSNRGLDSNLENRNGFGLQEAEMQFASDVDPYWRFVGTFSLSQEVDADKQALTPPVYESKYVFEPEEAYAETLDFSSFTVRVGKFKAALGKHNQLHTHAFPFIDAPLQNTVLLGGEGLNDVGISVATLLPFSWFSEISLQAFEGQGELDYFKPANANDAVALAHVKNLWDLSDLTTFEFGLSATTGGNSLGSSTQVYGADATVKWRKNLERALIWATEYLRRDYSGETGQGIASWLQFQLDRRWWLEARGEYLEIKSPVLATSAAPFSRKQSLLAAFDPSEFSEIRLEYDHLNDGKLVDENRALLQFNYTIGAHPAHAY